MNIAEVHTGGKVNHRAVNMVGNALDLAKIDAAYLFEDLGYAASDCPEWIPWNEWVQIMDRLAEKAGTDEDLREVGMFVFKAPSAIFLLRLVGFFADLGNMLVRMNELIMRSFFKGLHFQTEIDKKNSICKATITIPEELSPCRSFLVMSSAAYEAIFQKLNIEYRDFKFECTDRTGVYSFNYKSSLGLMARIRRIYRVILGADYAVKQIAANEDELRRRLEIVEAARADAEEAREKEYAARQLAEEALQVRQRFLAIMSHELRTPLNHIIGCVSLLLSDEETKEKRDYLDIIRDSSYNLLELIELVLDFSSAGSIFDEKPKAYSLTDILDPLIDKIRHASEEKNIQFAYPLIENGGPVIIIHAGHFKRILKLLLENAIKFTSDGQVVLDVQVTSEELVVLVQDTGIGIPEGWHQKVFEPFRAVDSSDTRTAGGIGLGLTIARKLAREIDGDLILEKSTSEGSTFRLTVPINMELAPAV